MPISELLHKQEVHAEGNISSKGIDDTQRGGARRRMGHDVGRNLLTKKNKQRFQNNGADNPQ
jgi:hypothetical protein